MQNAKAINKGKDLPGSWNVVLDLWRAEREGVAGLMQRQNVRLADLLVHARGASRFYRRLYSSRPSGLIRLGDLPVVNKRELMSAFDDWVTDPGVKRAGIEAFIADPSRIATPTAENFLSAPAPAPRAIPASSCTTVMRSRFTARSTQPASHAPGLALVTSSLWRSAGSAGPACWEQEDITSELVGLSSNGNAIRYGPQRFASSRHNTHSPNWLQVSTRLIQRC